MICPNCNVKLSKYSKYCPRCGILFESDDVEVYSKSFNNEYMEIYFPNKKLRFHIDRISIGYFLFTYFYAIYKKMYKIAIISFLLQYILVKLYIYYSNLSELGVAATLIPVAFFVGLIIFVYFYYVFNFDRLLIENRQLRVNKLLRENEGKTKDEIVRIMEEDSRNNFKGVIITLIVILIYIIFRIVL